LAWLASSFLSCSIASFSRLQSLVVAQAVAAATIRVHHAAIDIALGLPHDLARRRGLAVRRFILFVRQLDTR